MLNDRLEEMRQQLLAADTYGLEPNAIMKNFLENRIVLRLYLQPGRQILRGYLHGGSHGGQDSIQETSFTG